MTFLGNRESRKYPSVGKMWRLWKGCPPTFLITKHAKLEAIPTPDCNRYGVEVEIEIEVEVEIRISSFRVTSFEGIGLLSTELFTRPPRGRRVVSKAWPGQVYKRSRNQTPAWTSSFLLLQFLWGFKHARLPWYQPTLACTFSLSFFLFRLLWIYQSHPQIHTSMFISSHLFSPPMAHPQDVEPL